MTLGTAPALALTAARKTAGELHARVRLGEDPAAAKREEQRRAADTVEATLRMYLPEKKATVEPSTYIGTEPHLLRYAKPLHGLGVALVSRRDIASLLLASWTKRNGDFVFAHGGFRSWSYGKQQLDGGLTNHHRPAVPPDR
jgi:hypothetical protein